MTHENCDRVQEILVERGPTAFQGDPRAREHLVTCDECFAFLEAMSELDGRLRAMPPLEPSAALVEKTLASFAPGGQPAASTPRVVGAAAPAGVEAPATGAAESPAASPAPAKSAVESEAASPAASAAPGEAGSTAAPEIAEGSRARRWLRLGARLLTWPVRTAWGLVLLVQLVGRSARWLMRGLGRGVGALTAGLTRAWQIRLARPLIIVGSAGTVAAGLFLFVGVTYTLDAPRYGAMPGLENYELAAELDDFGGEGSEETKAYRGHANAQPAPAAEAPGPSQPSSGTFGKMGGKGIGSGYGRGSSRSGGGKYDAKDRGPTPGGGGGLAGQGQLGGEGEGGDYAGDSGILDVIAKKAKPLGKASRRAGAAQSPPTDAPTTPPLPDSFAYGPDKAEPPPPPPRPPSADPEPEPSVSSTDERERRPAETRRNVAEEGRLALLGTRGKGGAVGDLFAGADEPYEPDDTELDGLAREAPEVATTELPVAVEQEEAEAEKKPRPKGKRELSPKKKRKPERAKNEATLRRSEEASGFFDLTGEEVDLDVDDRLADEDEVENDRGDDLSRGQRLRADKAQLDIRTSPAGLDALSGLVGSDGELADGTTVRDSKQRLVAPDLDDLNRTSVATQARIVPAFRDGRAIGFKLFSVRPGSFWSRLGVQNGDIIQRVNGQPLDTPSRALAVYESQADAGRLVLEMQRRGQPVTVTCDRAGSTYTCEVGLGRTEASDPRVEGFLARYADLTGVSFRDATGYWANTYVPGDRVLRRLQKAVGNYDRGGLTAYAPRPVQLDDMARQHSQPFDPPTTSALAVYLHATERGITERSRMVVQVGMQATPRHSGRRPAMNVGIVLDLRDAVDPAAAAQVKALLEAFTKARDISDRFALVVAGKPGGVMVEPEAFRHGAVTVATQKIFDGRFVDPTDPTLSLGQALERAYAVVGRSDDPTSPLGSSVVILVTGRSLAGELYAVERAAHQHAVDGIPMSVVALGTPPPQALSEIDRVVLAGQGNRRLLDNPNQALSLVQRELSAVSRVVARAVRLRIRLAPGVKLIDVLGSHRLDEARAEQVRQAEKSIDLRMSRNLGITADRGEDEEGIQVVIPTFYAGDSHVFLLDVVAEGPGAIADVTVRYKDLVFLKNGVARDNLTLARRNLAQGPLERNVLKNLLAYELAGTCEKAGEELSRGDDAAALARLSEFRALIDGVRRELPGLSQDRDLMIDSQMLGEYAQLLGSGALAQTDDRAHLSNSLRFAGLLKLLPRPEQD